MKRIEPYHDLDGDLLDLSDLDDAERQLLDGLKDFAAQCGNYFDYANHWMPQVHQLYTARGLTREQIADTVIFKVAQDLGSRLMVDAGLARMPDYRDELETLIRSRFRTRRAFCDATGLSEDMLSHVLARRKHLAVDTLSEALGKIGYALHIAPMTEVQPH